MIRRATRARILALIAATAIAPGTSAADGSERCYNEWSDAAVVVRRQALTPVRELHTEARRRNLGDIVKVTLCEAQESFVYRLLVREPAGRVVTLVVSAVKPFAP